MLTLAINTASSQTSIAIISDGKIIQKSWKSKNNEAEKLLPELQKLLKTAQSEFSKINKVIVVKGPGSFTGLRIGVSVANTISYLNNCELFELDTFSYWWTGFSNSNNKKAALLVYAGSGGVYISQSHKSDPKLVNLDELNSFLKNNSIEIVFGDISAEQKEALEDVAFKEIQSSFGDIIHQSKPKKVKLVKPFYIKKPGITKSKKHILPK